MQKIEVDPDIGEVLIHLFSRPPVLASQGGHKKTPASAETGVRIGLVAGAGFEADSYSKSATLVTARWMYGIGDGGVGAMERTESAV